MHGVTGAEAEVADAAVGRDVLVLLADGLAAPVDLDGARPLGEFLGRQLASLVGEQGLQQSNGDRGGRSETGPGRRDVGEGRDLDATPNAGHVHGLAHEVVLDILDLRHDLLAGVVEVDVVVEALLHDDEARTCRWRR